MVPALSSAAQNGLIVAPGTPTTLDTTQQPFRFLLRVVGPANSIRGPGTFLQAGLPVVQTLKGLVLHNDMKVWRKIAGHGCCAYSGILLEQLPMQMDKNGLLLISLVA